MKGIKQKFKHKTPFYCWDCGSDLICIGLISVLSKWYCPHCDKEELEKISEKEEEQYAKSR